MFEVTQRIFNETTSQSSSCNFRCCCCCPLQAVTQELMLYWLQQLQLKRWQHRQMSTCPDLTNNNNTPGEKQTQSALSQTSSTLRYFLHVTLAAGRRS